ncbi:hypothetical protein PU02_0292 [Bartonella ancashensis]|uniref:Uncharacterized protein n=1 Tax=Bartonella ancashensis TaxID=1318743 RepID=A0A0M4LHQ7_9HYPH|nr:hypothetical protein PU02_0292 [Bartonella ancashensis]
MGVLLHREGRCPTCTVGRFAALQGATLACVVGRFAAS